MPKVVLNGRLQRDVSEDSVETAVEGWTLCPSEWMDGEFPKGRSGAEVGEGSRGQRDDN